MNLELSGLNIKHPNDFWLKLAALTNPSLTDWVAPLLYHTARLMEAKSTAEIGYGGGYCSIALGFHAKDFGGRHYVIDHDADRKLMYVMQANRTFDLNMEFRLMDASKIKWAIPLDLLFVDILASYDDMVNTLRNFAPAVVKDGLIIVHDYYCFTEIGRAVNTVFRDDYELLTLPFDGKPRLRRLPGKCGMAIARKL